MMNATMTQPPNSNFDPSPQMNNSELRVDKPQKLPPQTQLYHQPASHPLPQRNHGNVNLQDYPIFEELHPITNTQTFPNNATKSTNSPTNTTSNAQHTQPQLHTVASAPQYPNANNSNLNGFRKAPSNHQLSPNMSYQQPYNNYYNQPQQQPQTSPYGSPSSSSSHRSYPSWPGKQQGNVTHEVPRLQQHAPPVLRSSSQGARSAPFSDDSSYYSQQQQQPQPQQYTQDRLKSMYEEYHQYYSGFQRQQQQRGTNNNSTNRSNNNGYNMPRSPNNTQNNNSNKAPQQAIKSQSEYTKSLIQQVRELTQQRNEMQETISHLQKKIGTKKLLEEDFFSFLSRIEFPAWISDEERRLCLNKLFVNETQKLTAQLKDAKLARGKAASKNLMLETNIIELTDDITALREYLEQEKHRNYLESVTHNKNLAAKLAKHSASKHAHNNRHMNHRMNHHRHMNKYTHNKSKMDYPPENIIIQNLIRTQIEFYFSDYNLKRDKRLLDQLCSDRIGFLKIDSVMNLTRVRQLSSHRNQVINSLKHSKFLTLTHDNEWVGRLGFERPQEKQFPFRRTVFVFGLPMTCDEKYVTEMLSPFGKLSKVKFDHGPDTLDRLVAKNMFKEIKVYTYRDLNSRVMYNYKQEIMVGGSTEYNCNKCTKIKQCDEGFYETNSYQILICLQCAAASAEGILEKCKNNAGDNRRMIELLCGKPPRNTRKTKTALAVFTSQRQASKCVYVRSRIAFDGCFTTHYHHYSKLKKEIALSLQPSKDKLREIPSRRLLTDVMTGKGNVFHLGAATQPLGFEDFVHTQPTMNTHTNVNASAPPDAARVPIAPPKLHNNMDDAVYNVSPESLPLESLSSHSDASELEMIKSNEELLPSTNLMGSHTAELLPTRQPKLKNDFRSDNNNKFTSPKLKKSSAGSLTAPVVGGSGEIYLMRAAYNKVNNKNDSQKKRENSSTHESFVD